mgnify:CR=1 FL=1
MSIILDIIVVAIIALTVYFAYKNGFVKTAISTVSFLLAVAVTAMFASPLADFLKETSVAETVESTTSGFELEEDVFETDSTKCYNRRAFGNLTRCRRSFRGKKR